MSLLLLFGGPLNIPSGPPPPPLTGYSHGLVEIDGRGRTVDIMALGGVDAALEAGRDIEIEMSPDLTDILKPGRKTRIQ